MAREPKRAQQIAEQIEREILNRGLVSGHRLGTEPELVERYAVSRAVLREAIRMVERHQLAETRRGMGGGLFVAQPAEEAVARVLSAYLDSIGLELSELFEARRLLEGELVRLAAIRGGKRGARELEAILEGGLALDSARDAVALLDRFYARLGELTRSPGLALFVRALSLAGMNMALGLHFGREAAQAAYRAAWKRYRAIAKSIATHDVERAQSQIAGQLDTDEREWSARRRRRRALAPPGRIKQGDALARLIRERIESEGMRPGDRLGSETELLDRYGVSRSILREAIRLLEHHGVVEMRRGIGGGLVVSEPDPDSVVRAASVYLAHLGLTVEQIREVRLLLEPVGAALAAERASDADLAELAADLVARLELQGGRGLVAFRELHERIADLGGNRALALFTRVMIAAAWGLKDRAVRGLPVDALEKLRHSDTRIVGALHERDVERVTALMLDHLKFTLDWWAALHSRERLNVRPTRRRDARGETD